MKLNLNFPQDSHESYYHLVHITGLFTNGTEKYSVEVLFYKTDKNGNRKDNNILLRKVNIHQAFFLIVDSLWNSKSEMVCTSIRGLDKMSIVIEEGTVISSKSLNKILPNFRYFRDFLTNDAGSIASKTNYFEIVKSNISILIPIWEFFRTFYYIDKTIINYFFKGTELNNIGYIVHEESTIDTLKLVILDNKFNIREQFLIGQFLLTPEMETRVRLTHSMLKSFWAKNSLSLETDTNEVKPNLIHSFHAFNDIKLELKGFFYDYKYFSNELKISNSTIYKKCFYVTHIQGVKNFYNFKQLEADVSPDTRSLSDKTVEGDKIQTKERVSFQATDTSDIKVDSDLDGSSNYNNLNLYTDSLGYFERPEYHRNNKLHHENKYDSGTTQFFQNKPEALTTYGGGKDSNIAKGDVKQVITKIEIQELFNEIYNLFLKDSIFHKVSLINFSNVNGRRDNNYVLYTKDSEEIYKLGIIELMYRNSFFYYIQSFHVGRGAFICSTKQLKKYNLLDLLNISLENDWNWSGMRHDLTIMLQINRVIGIPIKIYSRNHVKSAPIVKLCKENIESFLNIN